MKKIIYSLICAFFIFGCVEKDKKGNDFNDDTNTGFECNFDPSYKKEAHACILSCIKEAKTKPADDDESEDIILACTSSCKQIYCVRDYYFYFDIRGSKVYCRGGLSPEYDKICDGLIKNKPVMKSEKEETDSLE